MAGDHQHGGGRVDLAQGVQHLEAVAVGQPDVEENQVGPALAVKGQAVDPVFGLQGVVAFVRQHVGKAR